MDEKKLLELVRKHNPNQFGLIAADKIPFKQETRALCEANACGKYGTNWMCPPAVGTIEVMEAICRSYQKAILFNTVAPIEDSFDFEGMMAAGEEHKKMTAQIRNEIKTLYPGEDFMVLGAGGCNKCERCTYLDGEPCRYPDEVTASMEACGIFVVDLCAAAGFHYINGANTVTYFSLILFN